MIGTEDVNDIVDEMILRAFDIITKGVRFLDVWEDDHRSRVAPAVTVMNTLLEEAYVLLTPPADSAAFDATHTHPVHVGARAEVDGNASDRTPSAAGEVTPALIRRSNRLSAVCQQSTNVHRLSQNSLVQANRFSSSISHRVSLAGPSCSSQPGNLVSERLNTCHDTFLSHLGSFIGRLQLQSQSRPSLAIAIRQSATSGGELLLVVDVVCAHTSISIDALEQARDTMYNRIQELVHTARDILTNPEPDMEEDVIVPHDNGRLLWAASALQRPDGSSSASATLSSSWRTAASASILAYPGSPFQMTRPSSLPPCRPMVPSTPSPKRRQTRQRFP
jgi:hypothetical protein